MKLKNIAGKRNINAFVSWKISLLKEAGPSFEKILPLMFSEKDNVFYERSEGYRITRTTYGESYRNVERKRRAIRRLLKDFPENSTVGLWMENGPSWVEDFWAILGAGYCPLLLNMRLPEKSLREAFVETGAVAVLTDSRTFEGLMNLHEENLSGDFPESPGKFGEYFFVMSSGTSGHGKLCAYTAAEVYHILLDADQIVRKSKLMKKHFRGELKQLDFLPFYHIFGFVAVYLWFSFFSRTFVHLNDMGADTILRTIRRHHVTHIFAVPLFWEKVFTEASRTIRERGEETYRKFQLGLRLSNRLSAVPFLEKAFSKAAFREVRKNLFGESISFTISGGGPIRREVLEFFNGIGYHFVDGYGMSEIAITSVELSLNRKRILAGSVGKPLSSVSYRINEAGELLVHGLGVSGFILSDGVRRDRGEWFNSHDLAAERNGRYYILGRQDELIVGASGENLNPNLYEPEFFFDGIREACILPVVEEGRMSPVLLLSVEPFREEEEAVLLREKVRKKLMELNLSGEIRKVHMTSVELLQGDEFKLNRKRLLKAYEAGEFPEAALKKNAGALSEDAVTEKVLQIFEKALDKKPGEIPQDADFFTELGGSSLDYFMVISAVEKEFSLLLPADKDDCLTTAEKVSEYIRENGKFDS